MLALAVGIFLVMILPGYIWSKVFFDVPDKKPISIVERMMWSMFLSLAIIPMMFIVINDFFAIPINTVSVTAFVTVVCIPGVYLILRRNRAQ